MITKIHVPVNYYFVKKIKCEMNFFTVLSYSLQLAIILLGVTPN